MYDDIKQDLNNCKLFMDDHILKLSLAKLCSLSIIQ